MNSPTLLALLPLWAALAPELTAQTTHTADVYVDADHVPHIFSPTDEGAFFALGRLHVQDFPVLTLFNIANGSGRAAAYLSPPEGIPADDFRALKEDMNVYRYGLRQLATGHAAHLSVSAPDIYGILEAYVAGVDAERLAQIGQLSDYVGCTLPVGMNLEQLQRLYDFEPTVLDLLTYGAWINSLGPTFYARSILADPGAAPAPMGLSNSWAFDPTLSATGNAQLLSDPHLGDEIPLHLRSYLVSMEGATYSAAGWSSPGWPGIVLGAGANVAWAGTTNSLSITNVWRATTNAAGDAYPLGSTNQMIEVETMVPFEAWDFVNAMPVTLHRDFRWADTERLHPILETSAPGAAPDEIFFARSGAQVAHSIFAFWIDFARAADVTEVQTLFRKPALLAQHFMVTDTNGGLFYIDSGLVPERNAPNDTSWWFEIQDGSDPARRYLGFHDGTELPQELRLHTPGSTQGEVWINNNAEPQFVRDNSTIVPSAFPAYMLHPDDVGSNLRQERARELLDAATQQAPLTVADNEIVATDIRNNWGHIAWPYIKQVALDFNMPQLAGGQPMADAIVAIDAWDFDADLDSPEMPWLAMTRGYFEQWAAEPLIPGLPPLDGSIFRSHLNVPALADFHPHPSSPYYLEALTLAGAFWQATVLESPVLGNDLLIAASNPAWPTPTPFAGRLTGNTWGTANTVDLSYDYITGVAAYPVPGCASSLFMSLEKNRNYARSLGSLYGKRMLLNSRGGGTRSALLTDMDATGPSMRFLASIGNGELVKQTGVVSATLPKYRLADRFVQRQWTPMLRTLLEVQAVISTPTHAFAYTTP